MFKPPVVKFPADPDLASHFDMTQATWPEKVLPAAGPWLALQTHDSYETLARDNLKARKQIRGLFVEGACLKVLRGRQ